MVKRANGVTEEDIIRFKKITDEMNATYKKALKDCDEIPILEICQKCKFNYSNGGCDYCRMEDICVCCAKPFRVSEETPYCREEDAFYCVECAEGYGEELEFEYEEEEYKTDSK